MVSRADSPAPITVEQVLSAAFPVTIGTRSSNAAEYPVHMIPQGSEPRWIVLGDSRLAAPVLRSWRPFKISTRVRWAGVVSASAAGMLARLPGVVHNLMPIDLAYWKQSLHGFSDDWVPVVYLGNPSHSRKVTVFFIGPDRQFHAVAKIPWAAAASEAILHEADILHRLEGAPFLPRTLFQDPERGIAAQSWLEGEPVSRHLTPEHMDLLSRFMLPGRTMRLCDHRAGIGAALDRADLPFDRGILSRALEVLEEDRELPASIEHRDFAPWNLKRLVNGQTGAVDWEWAILDGLPCQDVFRYFYIQDALFNGPGNVWQIIQTHPLLQAHYRRFQIPNVALPGLAVHYLLRALCMDWSGGNTRLAEYGFGQITSLLKR